MIGILSPERSPLQRAGFVMAGYAVAFALATIAVALHNQTLNAAGVDTSGGMHAFGDMLLFGAVSGMVGLLPTGLALVYLRAYPRFWLVLATAGFVFAMSGMVALLLYMAGRGEPQPSALAIWAAFAMLRILPAPLFAAVDFVAAVIAPHRLARLALFAATVVEMLVCAGAAAVFLVQ